MVMACRPRLHGHARVWACLPGFSRDAVSSLFLRFDFTAPRAWGSWQGKLFSNNDFNKQSGRQSYVSSGSSRLAEGQEGQGAGRGTGKWAPAPTRPLTAWPCHLGQAPNPLWAICTMKPLDSTVSMKDVAS